MSFSLVRGLFVYVVVSLPSTTTVPSTSPSSPPLALGTHHQCRPLPTPPTHHHPQHSSSSSSSPPLTPLPSAHHLITTPANHSPPPTHSKLNTTYISVQSPPAHSSRSPPSTRSPLAFIPYSPPPASLTTCDILPRQLPTANSPHHTAESPSFKNQFQ